MECAARARGILVLSFTDARLALILVALAALALLGSVTARAVPAGSSRVACYEVQVSGAPVLRLDPRVNGVFAVEGPLGETQIEIRDGRARIVASPCREPAWHGGWLSRLGQKSICLPNRVVIEAEGGGALGGVLPDSVDGFDAETR